VRILGREPTVWLALFAALVQGVSGFFGHLSDDQQAVLNACAVALFGLLTALAVRGDYLLPAILGFVKAVLAVGLGFGLHLDAAQQSTLMIVVTAVGAVAVRDRVIAPVPPRVVRVQA
jgi:hypothetical protein